MYLQSTHRVYSSGLDYSRGGAEEDSKGGNTGSRVGSAWVALFCPRAKTPHDPPARPQQQLHLTAGAFRQPLGLMANTGHRLSLQLAGLHVSLGWRAEGFPILNLGSKLRGPFL